MVITGQTIAYCLLFCLALNFMNQFFAIFLLFFIGIWFIVPLRSRVPKPAHSRLLILTLFVIAYLATFYYYEGFSFPKTVVILSFWGMFFIGSQWKRTPEKCITSILVVVIGTACHCILNLLRNFSLVASGTARSTIDFWLNAEWIITGQISLFILLAGAAYYVLFCLKFSKAPVLKAFLLFLLFGGLYYNMQLGNRTTVFATVLSLLIGSILNNVLNGKKPLLLLRNILVTALGIGLLFALYEMDIFGLTTWFESTAFFNRLDAGIATNTADMDSRWGQISKAFTQLISVPWGGYQMQFTGVKVDFVHNTWLNIAFGYGSLTAMLFFVFCLLLIPQIGRLLKTKRQNSEKILIAGMFVSVLCYLSLEPVCEAAPQIISLMCFLSGTVEQIIWNANHSTLEETV